VAAGRAFDVDAFLERPLVARVATNGPTVRPVWFIWEEGCLWWLTGPWSRLEDHLSRDPRLHVSIDTCDLASGEVRQVRMVGDGRVVAYDHARAQRKPQAHLRSGE
jgi:nitroimidazol reductase NimA-like FMN-containing flavoprotein (pyridoxamine 5'-phosphate oxidase superfamily)